MSDLRRKIFTVNESKSSQFRLQIDSIVLELPAGNGFPRRKLNRPRTQSSVPPVEGSCVASAAELNILMLIVLKTLVLKRLYKNPSSKGGGDATSVMQWWS